MGHGDASSLLRTSSASERDAAAHAEDQRQRAEAATTAADLELARVQAEVASVRARLNAITVREGGGNGTAAISPSRVICTGWAVAASPVARATVQEDIERGALSKMMHGIHPTVKAAAAGKVVYRLRAVYDEALSSIDVYRRWSEIEALVGALRGLGNPQLQAAIEGFQ